MLTLKIKVLQNYIFATIPYDFSPFLAYYLYIKL